jgi:hypothetical protein
MFAIEVIGPTGQLSRLTVDTFEKALAAYAAQAWDDPPHILLGRTVIIREFATGDVWAVGSYVPDDDSPDSAPMLRIMTGRRDSIVVFRHVEGTDGAILTARSVHSLSRVL